MIGLTMTADEIRPVLCRFRGGWENATDAQVVACWRSLDDATRREYLEAVSPAAQPVEAVTEWPHDHDDDEGTGCDDGREDDSD